MIEYLQQTRQLLLYYPEWAIIFWTFCTVKAFGNSLRHNYKRFKIVLGIPDRWDWWFDPSQSHNNKYENWIWRFLAPFSDFWHTIWTVWQFYFVIQCVFALHKYSTMLHPQFFVWAYIIYGVGIVGIVGVFIIFNGFYNWLKQTKFIHWL